jgi:SPP1 gp7 family putative phage head morphogenesis protein
MPARKTEEAPSEAVNAQPEVKPEVKPEVPPTPAKIEASERRIVYSKFAEKIFTGVRRRTFTEYEEATDFNELRDIVESNSYDATVSIAETLREGVDGILKDIVNKKIIEDKNFPAIDKLHLKYLGDIKDGFKGALSKVYEQGMRSARREIIEKKKISKFEAAFDFRNMTPKEALEYFANKSYFMAQVERDFVFKTLKPIIYNAIKSGATIKDFIDETNKALEPYFVTGALDEAAFNSYRLETILRTNLNEAMNEGRKAFFESPETKGYVQAYQYSAILDDRVRENHAALDGLIFSITSPAIARISPPNGYNCRCLLIPVTEDEKWEEDKLPGGWGADAGFDKPGY